MTNREIITVRRGDPITAELLNKLLDLGRGNPLPPGNREFDDGVNRSRRDGKHSRDAGAWFPARTTTNAPAFSLLKVYSATITEDGVSLFVGLPPAGDDGRGVYAGNEEYELLGTPSASGSCWVKLVTPSDPVRVAIPALLPDVGFMDPVKPDGGLSIEPADTDTSLACVAQVGSDLFQAAVVSAPFAESAPLDASGDDAWCECAKRSILRPGYQEDGFFDTYAVTIGGITPTPPIGSQPSSYEDCDEYVAALQNLLAALNTQHDLLRQGDTLVWQTVNFNLLCDPVVAPTTTTSGTTLSTTPSTTPSTTTTPPTGSDFLRLTITDETNEGGLPVYVGVLELVTAGGCCYAFKALCSNFNAARGNKFEIVDRHTNCLQFSWCVICVKPGSHGDYEPEDEEDLENSDPITGTECAGTFDEVCDSYARDWYVVAGAQFIPPPPDADSELRDGRVIKRVIPLESTITDGCNNFVHDGFANAGGSIAVTWTQEIFTPGSEGVEGWWLRWKASLTLGPGSMDAHPVSLSLSITTGVTEFFVTDPPGFGDSGVHAEYTGTFGCNDGSVRLTKQSETWTTISGNIASGPHGTCPWQLPATVTAVPGDRIELYEPLEGVPEDRDGDCVPEYAPCVGCGHPPTGTTGTTQTTVSTSASLSTTTTTGTTTTTPPPTGACCVDAADGCGRICFEDTEADCLASFGNPTYAGDGTTCGTHDCCNGYGSCCDESTGNCTDGVTEAQCIALYGLNHTWSEGNNCAVMTCPV